MKINDVIKKCIKIPGISIKQAEYSMELILNTKEGKGSMTFFSLFPGLSLAYIFINSPVIVLRRGRISPPLQDLASTNEV